MFDEVAARLPRIHVEFVYGDAMSLCKVQTPWDYDMLVMRNQFAGILADPLAAILSGAMMLEWLGQYRDDAEEARVLLDGTSLAPDLGGRAVEEGAAVNAS